MLSIQSLLSGGEWQKFQYEKSEELMLLLQQLFWINGVWLHAGKGRAFSLQEVSIILTDTTGKKTHRKQTTKKKALEGISAIWNAYTKFILTCSCNLWHDGWSLHREVWISAVVQVSLSCCTSV